MQKKKGVALVTASMALCITACGSSTGTTAETQAVDEIVEAQATDNNATASETGKEAREPGSFQKEGGYFGSITAIDGNTITVSVMNGRIGGGRPEGEMPSGEKPDGEMPAGEMPTGEKPDVEMPEGMASETMTIEVTENTVITVNGETADISSLEVGSDIMFTLNGETALTITVRMPEQGTENTAE